MLRVFLIVSLGIAFLVAFASALFTILRIKFLRRKYASQENLLTYQRAFEDPSHGQIISQLKKDASDPLQDEQLVFAVATIMRNSYRTSCVAGFEGTYEQTSLEKIARQKIVADNFAFLLLKSNSEVVAKLEQMLPKLSAEGMIFIAHGKNDKIQKTSSWSIFVKTKIYELVTKKLATA
ncbi:hypothetical protein [Mycoplasma sp. ATU-Cv-508]|uniref:hypothetical protein n=1 Tax=Mycoplasma sp. ATU-Cv-508 TaxID=2048001 RepID=UPI000FDD4BD0